MRPVVRARGRGHLQRAQARRVAAARSHLAHYLIEQVAFGLLTLVVDQVIALHSASEHSPDGM